MSRILLMHAVVLGMCVLALGGCWRSAPPPSVPPVEVGQKNAAVEPGAKTAEDPAGKSPLIKPAGGWSGWKPRETVLLSAAEARDLVPNTWRVSPDGRRFAYALNKRGGQVVVLDRAELPTICKQVHDLLFSDDGNDFAFTATINRGAGNGLGLFLNGKLLPVADLKQPTILAVGGGKVVTPVERGRQVVVVHRGVVHSAALTSDQVLVDGKEAFKLSQGVEAQEGFQLSADSSTWAFIAKQGADHYPIINGDDKKRFPQVSALTLSPDGKRYAHLAARPETGKTYAVVDGKVHDFAWNDNREHHRPRILFNRDGTRWAAASGTKLLVDGVDQKLPHSAIVLADTLAFSPDGKRLACVVRLDSRLGLDGKEVRDPRMVLLVDSKEEQTFKEIVGNPLWAPAGASIALMAVTAEGKAPIAMFAAKPMKRYDQTQMVGYAPDGKSHAVLVRHSEEARVVLDGQERAAYEEIGLAKTRVGFTPNGKLTFLARKADNAIVWVEEIRGDLPYDDALVASLPSTGWRTLYDGTTLAGCTGTLRQQTGYGSLQGKMELETTELDIQNFHLRAVVKTTRNTNVWLTHLDSQMWIDDRTRKAPYLSLNESGSPEFAQEGEWFTIDLLAFGDRRVARVNGKKFADVKASALPVGPIKFASTRDYPLDIHRLEVRRLLDAGALNEKDDPKKPTGPERTPEKLPEFKLEEGFTPLFNGKDLEGFVTYSSWAVQDGILRPVGINSKTHMHTKKSYRDFHLRVVARAPANSIADICFRRPEPRPDERQYTVRINPKAADKRLMGEVRGHVPMRGVGFVVWEPGLVNKPPAIKPGEWFTVDIIAQGTHVTSKLNGTLVSQGSHVFDAVPDLRKKGRYLDLVEGLIGLSQLTTLDGPIGPVEYLRLDIKELSPPAKK